MNQDRPSHAPQPEQPSAGCTKMVLEIVARNIGQLTDL
jgi:hypothetical protein